MGLSIPSTNVTRRKCQYFLETRTHKSPKISTGPGQTRKSTLLFQTSRVVSGACAQDSGSSQPGTSEDSSTVPSELARLQASQLAGCQGVLVPSPHSLLDNSGSSLPAACDGFPLCLGTSLQGDACPASLMNVVSVQV